MDAGTPLQIGVIIQNLAVPIAFLVGLVLALVEFSKKAGAKDATTLILAMVFSIMLGGGYYLASFGVPTEIAGWFLLVLVALIPGLAASGVYDLTAGRAKRAGVKKE